MHSQGLPPHAAGLQLRRLHATRIQLRVVGHRAGACEHGQAARVLAAAIPSWVVHRGADTRPHAGGRRRGRGPQGDAAGGGPRARGRRARRQAALPAGRRGRGLLPGCACGRAPRWHLASILPPQRGPIRVERGGLTRSGHGGCRGPPGMGGRARSATCSIDRCCCRCGGRFAHLAVLSEHRLLR